MFCNDVFRQQLRYPILQFVFFLTYCHEDSYSLKIFLLFSCKSAITLKFDLEKMCCFMYLPILFVKQKTKLNASWKVLNQMWCIFWKFFLTITLQVWLLKGLENPGNRGTKMASLAEDKHLILDISALSKHVIPEVNFWLRLWKGCNLHYLKNICRIIYLLRQWKWWTSKDKLIL